MLNTIRLVPTTLLLGAVLLVASAAQTWIHALGIAIIVCVVIWRLPFRLVALMSWVTGRQRWLHKLEPLTAARSLRVPCPGIAGKDVERLLSHEDATAKAGSGMRALITYWQAPASECQPEVMERSPVYELLLPVTGRVLQTPVATIRQVARTQTEHVVARERARKEPWSLMPLGLLAVPIGMNLSHEVIFGEPCPPSALPIFLHSLFDIFSSTGGFKRRNMEPRLAFIRYMAERIDERNGMPEIFGDESPLTLDQKAKYLVGTWFHAAPAQVVRLATLVVECLTRDEQLLAKFRDAPDDRDAFLDRAFAEVLRLFPTLTASNRITSKDITLTEGGRRIPAGTNVVFDFVGHHRMGYENPHAFDPERWRTLNKRDVNYMPFGVGKRRCPAERFALVAAKEIAMTMLTSFEFHFPSSRDWLLPGRARFRSDLCIVVRRGPIGTMRVGLWKQALGWYLMLIYLKLSVLHLLRMGSNAREAFADYAADLPRPTPQEAP